MTRYWLLSKNHRPRPRGVDDSNLYSRITVQTSSCADRIGAQRVRRLPWRHWSRLVCLTTAPVQNNAHATGAKPRTAVCVDRGILSRMAGKRGPAPKTARTPTHNHPTMCSRVHPPAYPLTYLLPHRIPRPETLSPTSHRPLARQGYVA